MVSKLATKLIDPVMALLLGELSGKNKEDRIFFTVRFLRQIMLLSSMFSVIIFLLSDTIVLVMFSDTFLPSTPLLKYLSFSIVLLAWSNVIANFFNANGTPIINLCISILTYCYLMTRLYFYPLGVDVRFLSQVYVEFSVLSAFLHFAIFWIITRVRFLEFLPTKQDCLQLGSGFSLFVKSIVVRFKSVL